jgi:hypothetical protein
MLLRLIHTILLKCCPLAWTRLSRYHLKSVSFSCFSCCSLCDRSIFFVTQSRYYRNYVRVVPFFAARGVCLCNFPSTRSLPTITTSFTTCMYVFKYVMVEIRVCLFAHTHTHIYMHLLTDTQIKHVLSSHPWRHKHHVSTSYTQKL